MENHNERTPWEWLAQIANQVIHEQQTRHSRSSNSGIVHAGTHDFELAFLLPMKVVISKARLALLRDLASKAPPGLGQMALDEQAELNKLYFEMAKRDNPDK